MTHYYRGSYNCNKDRLAARLALIDYEKIIA